MWVGEEGQSASAQQKGLPVPTPHVYAHKYTLFPARHLDEDLKENSFLL